MMTTFPMPSRRRVLRPPRGGPWVPAALIAAVLLGSTDAAGATSRPPVGLVLSGGGARGGAHVGVLQVLEELRVPVDYVAGTSAGAIVGGLYCTGRSPQQLEAIFGNIDWEAAFRDRPERRHMSFRRKEDDNLALFPIELGVGKHGFSTKSGILRGQRIEFILHGLTLDSAGQTDFDRFPIPFRAVAADLETGDAVVLDHGDLAQAMRASMSIPGILTPVELDGRLLVDGGIAANLPVDVARNMGAGRIIAIDVGTHPKGVQEHLSAVGVYSQVLAVLMEKNVAEQLRHLTAEDVLITPDLGDVRSADFPEIEKAIAAGEAAARSREAELRRFSVSEEEFAAFLRRQRREPEPVEIDAVEVRGVGRLDPEVLTSRMQTQPGEGLDLADLRRDLERISQVGEFESVGFHLEERGGRNRLIVQAEEKSWGPGYLRFGVGVESNLDGDSDSRAIVNYRRPGINRLGAEWETNLIVGDPALTSSEFFQPLDVTGFWFVAPRGVVERDRDETFLITGEREVVETKTFRVGLDFGVQFRNYGEIRLGAVAGRLDIRPVTTSTLADLRRHLGAVRLKATLDQVDSVFFPTRGNLTDLELLASRETFGADDEFDKLFFATSQAFTLGRNTLVAGLELGSDLGSELPFYERFELGGFLNLSGFKRGQLRGNVKGLLTLLDYWRIGRLGTLGKLYLGAAAQAGNVWPDVNQAEFGDLLYSGTLFFGLDASFAPVYVGYGLAEGGEAEFYLFIGQLFGR